MFRTFIDNTIIMCSFLKSIVEYLNFCGTSMSTDYSIEKLLELDVTL